MTTCICPRPSLQSPRPGIPTTCGHSTTTGFGNQRPDMGLAGGWHCVADAQAPGLPVLAQDLHETRRPSPFPNVLQFKSATGPQRPASGTFHRSVPVMPVSASIPVSRGESWANPLRWFQFQPLTAAKSTATRPYSPHGAVLWMKVPTRFEQLNI